MPEKDKLSSWLMTPKRRRTTGNLKSIPHGQQMKPVAEEDGSSEKAQADAASSGGLASLNALARTVPPPNGISSSDDGNLFYAYARKTDEPDSHHLLTFASASTAAAWWLLVQSNFADCSRPSLQLFSFREPDLLLRAWNHPALQHLRSKWMYTALSDAGPHQSLGRASQAVIPIQDEMGNVLGQSKEQSAVFEDLDTRFQRMLQNTERNTEHVGRLVDREGQADHNGSNGNFEAKGLSSQFDKLTDMMARNIEFMERMSEKQLEHEQRLTAALESVSSKRREDRVDLSQLSAHLDRVNRTLDQTAATRRDSTRVEPSPAVDLNPLTTTLEKMQEAIEQNSLLTEKLLEERSTADAEARYKNQLDLLPISESLERIYEAVDKQNLHTIALLEVLRDDKDDALRANVANGETLDRILQAQIETKEAVEQTGGEIDFAPVAEHMDAIREVTTENTEQITAFIELQKTASVAESTARTTEIDFSPMTDRLDRVHATLERSTGYFQAQSPGTGDPQFLMSALSSHLSKIQAVTEQNAVAIKKMRDNTQTLPLPLSPPQSQLVDETTHSIIRETNEHLQSLTRALETHQTELEEKRSAAVDAEKDRALEKRVEATSSQVRELMAGQRELVHVMRELALNITSMVSEEEKKRKKKGDSGGGGGCEHVVIPPPRKVGRKIVGFVYDGVEGSV